MLKEENISLKGNTNLNKIKVAKIIEMLLKRLIK